MQPRRLELECCLGMTHQAGLWGRPDQGQGSVRPPPRAVFFARLPHWGDYPLCPCQVSVYDGKQVIVTFWLVNGRCELPF